MTSSTPAHVAEFQAELRTFDDDIARLRADPLPTPDVPVTIITGVKRTRKLGPGTGDEARDAVLAANQRRAASFPKGRHVSAEHSTHYVPFTEPEIVVAETLALVDAARAEVPTRRPPDRSAAEPATAHRTATRTTAVGAAQRPHPTGPPMPTTRDRSHRRNGALLALAALLLAALLAGCGGSDAGADGGSGSSADGSGASDDSDDGGTVTIEHRYGTTEVPVDPERIVSLDLQWTDVLGRARRAAGRLPRRPERAGRASRGAATCSRAPPPSTATDTLPYEQIAALKPDLIVVAYFAQEQADYDKLSAIAPTVATLSDAQVDTWQDITTAAGKILGEEDDAAELVASVDGDVAAVAEELPGLEGKTFTLVNYVPGDQFYVVSDPEDGAVVLFDQLGMEIAPAIVEAGEGGPGRVELSLENTELLDADLILVLTNGAEADTIPGWEDLEAVKDDAVAVLDYALATAVNTPTPLSIPYSLEELRPALEAAAS